MSGAYIEMLPPDRPIFMLGQPIIKLVPSGGPGGDLGDVGFNPALQQELQVVAGGGAPDVSAEYFRPKDLPGLPSEYEGPHTGRQGVYPKKLRDMVVYDMSGTTFVRPSDLAGAKPMPNYGGLGCCGADDMSGYGMPYFDTAMGQADVAEQAKQLQGRCERLESKAKEIVAAVAKANADKSISQRQRKVVADEAKKSLTALRNDWRQCRKRIKQIISQLDKNGAVKQTGLAGLADKIEKEDRLAKCRERLRQIHDIACANGHKKPETK